MSDGPHRSLPMRPGWKKVAERAHNQVFSVEEVLDATADAAGDDWRKEMPRGFIGRIKHVLGPMMLFNEDSHRLLESIRPLVSGSVMGNSFLDFLSCAMGERGPGKAALWNAMEDALRDRVKCGMRQVEEHYIRALGTENALNMRHRLGEVFESMDFGMLARKLLDPHSQPTRHVGWRGGLDDGVPL